MVAKQGNISAYFGPTELGAPDAVEDAVVSFIAGAKRSLDIAVQELESEVIARTLTAAVERKVRIRLVLEESYLSVTKAAARPWDVAARVQNDANRRIFAAVMRGGVHVRTDFNPAIFHQKFVVRDIDGPSPAVLTGSANFTPTGMHANLNHVCIMHSKTAASEYADEFAEIWDGTFGANRQRHDPAPRNFTVSRIPVKILFAPEHAPEMEIMKQMLKAKTRIDFAVFTFAQSSGIDDTMIALSRAGITVRGIFDRGQGNQKWAASHGLKAAGIEVYRADRGAGLNKLHHKLMVIDERLMIGGSFNYTDPANRLNDENIFILGDLDETDPGRIAVHRAFVAHAGREIDRMIADHGTPY